MEIDATGKPSIERPCCAKVKERYMKSKERIEFLRNALHKVEPMMVELQNETLKHKKSYEAEVERVKLEKEAREREASARESLEKEILKLRSEITLLEKNKVSGYQNGDGEVNVFRNRVTELEGEIHKLKEILEEERQKGELQRKKVEEEKKKSEEACKVEKEERLKELSVRAGLEKEIEKLKSEIAVLKESRGTVDNSDDGNVILLQNRVLAGETEISRLTELLEKERESRELEKKRVQQEKKLAEEKWKIEAEQRSKESSIRDELENEISRLKSELDSLMAGKYTKNGTQDGEVVLLQTRVSELESETNRLKELLDQEKKRAESEKKKTKAEKKKVKALGLGADEQQKKSSDLENEIVKLNSEVESLQKLVSSREQDEALLQSRVSEFETEIQRLGELLTKERKRGDLEKRRAEAEKNKASEAWKLLKTEKNKVEASQAEASGLREKLLAESSKIEEAHRRLEAEKQVSNREKKRAELEMSKSEEQKKCVEEEKKKLMDEKRKSNFLSQKLEEARQRNQLLDNEIQEIVSAAKKKDAAHVMPNLSRDSGDIALLEKHLKLEKMHVKHAKRVAKFQKLRNNLLKQELLRLKQEFVHFGQRLNVLDGCFYEGVEGIDASGKINNSLKIEGSDGNNKFSGKEAFSLYGKSKNGVVKARYTSMDCFDHFRSSVECSRPLCDENGSSTKPIPGISSESLIGGSVRNTLQNSASTSFSDGPSVGSQENNIFSAPRSENWIENLRQGEVIPGSSAGNTGLRIRENLTFDGDKNVNAPACRDMGLSSSTLNEHDNINVVDSVSVLKRKTLSDEVGSTKCLPTAVINVTKQIEENLTAVNDALVLESNIPKVICSQSDRNLNASGGGRSANALLLDHVHTESYISSKKRKMSLRQEDILEPCRSNVVNEMIDDDTCPLNLDNCFMETVQSCQDEAIDAGHIHQDNELFFEKMTGEDIMKLLELDDPDDEERFRTAMETPLSPTLPEIEMPSVEEFDMNEYAISKGGMYTDLVNGFHDGILSCRVSNVEIDSDQLKFKNSDNSQCPTLCRSEGYECTVDESQNEDTGFQITYGTESASPSLVLKCSIEMEATKLHSENEVVKVSHTLCEEDIHGNISKYFVAFPNTNDNRSISRMISTCENCISDCSLVSKEVWMVEKFLDGIAKEEDLLAEEKTCVFFSLLLHNFLIVTSVNSRNCFAKDVHSSSTSFLTHLETVVSDGETRNKFLELIQMDTLLSLVESFLLDKRVIVYDYASNQQHLQCDSQNITLMDGTSILLSRETATTDKLVAGSFILASLCAITGHIGFLCEASYKFLRMCKSDSFLTLTMLHVFASLCGSEYVNSSRHSIIMTVVRSIVTLLERENVSMDAPCGSFVQYEGGSPHRFTPCAECAFSHGVASVDEVINLLMQNLQDYALRVVGYEPNNGISDIFSLVELVASYMGWNWARSKVIPQLLKIVESSVTEEFSAAVILLIGEVGRFGADDCEQLGVEELTCTLAAFLNRRTKRSWGLCTQLAIVQALTGLLSVNFDEFVKSEVLPSERSQHVLANLVSSWFSQLNEEEKCLACVALQPAGH